MDAYQIYLGSTLSLTTYVPLNLFTLIETLFLFYFFRQITTSRSIHLVIVALASIYVIIWFFLLFKIGIRANFTISYGLECICIIGLSVYYFFEQVRKPDSFYIYSQTRFWVVAAYLIYTAGTFFLFLYLSDLSLIEQRKYFVLNSGFLILKTIILSIAMLMKTRVTERKKFQLT